MKIILIKQLIIIILGLCYLNAQGTPKILIKASILRGERFVTVNTSAKEIEDRVSEVFKKKGFVIVSKIDPTGDILFVDFFVYQLPAQYPAVTVTIRTPDGIHYIDQEYKKVFADRELTNLNLATELAERVPVAVNKDLVRRVSIGDLISTNKTSSTALYAGNSKYYSTIKWKDDNNVPFIIPNDLGLYLLYASNFTGLKKQLTGGPIVLRLKINDSARFELDINSKLNLDEDQRIRIQEFIDSFPLWMVNAEVQNIEIIYGIR